MKTLFVVDASGYLYRSYFAIKNMTNTKGESTNALFGFIRSLSKLRKDFSPEHLVATFDGPRGGKPRQAIYSEYKAHRLAMPEDLRYQIERAKQACELMGISYLSVPEVEADDTMGSVASWASKQDALVYLCTSDKDLAQLVNDRIFLLNTFKDNQILGVKEVEETYGVPPHQMIDFLSITGDSSDNIPGIPGFGPKTAAALLKEFGSLDYILANPSVVSGKKQEVLRENIQNAEISRRLAIINTEVEFPRDKSFFTIKSPNLPALKEFYASMNFNTLLKELETSIEILPTPLAEEVVIYQLVDDADSFQEMLADLLKTQEIALSICGTEDQPLKSEILGFAFCSSAQLVYYVPANGKLGLEHVLKGLKLIFENPNIAFYGHNVKYDCQLLCNHGVKIAKLSFDTMLASYLLNSHSRQHTLEYLMLELFGKVKIAVQTLLGKGKKSIPLADVSLNEMTKYCGENVLFIYRIKEILLKKLQERGLYSLFQDLELPLLDVLAKMERKGIYVDVNYLHAMSNEVAQQIANLEQTIYNLAGEEFNINSPKQLSQILFVKMGIYPPKKTATGLSTNVDVLESLQSRYPIAGKILEYRSLEKLRSTYLDALPFDVNPSTKRIHCTFNQSVAATGRLSCQNPNLQNIPIRSEIGRKIRGAFQPQQDHWSFLAADYSQIELRILAHLSHDPVLIEAFKAEEDIHTLTAAHIYHIPMDQVTKVMRYNAKAVNFGVIYGQQAFGLSQELGIDLKEASSFIEAYFKRYKRVKEYLEESKDFARKTGKAVTYVGRERLIPEISSKNGMLRAAAERLAINTPLQGTAADMIKMAMLQMDQKISEQKLSSFMVLQIHDELIFEVPDTELEIMKKLVRQVMENVLTLTVPLVVDINVGKNWAEC